MCRSSHFRVTICDTVHRRLAIDNNQSTFFRNTLARQDESRTLLCVGLDPDPALMPASLAASKDGIFAFNRDIIDATADLVCCYKPQIAFYASRGAEDQLDKTIAYIKERGIPVLLDAKRGDVASTSRHYATEVFERYGADAVTVNPYLGLDAMAPYLEYRDRGVFILCRTSNPGGADLQNLVLDTGPRIFEHIAYEAANSWNYNGNVGLVVGATHPAELARVRNIAGDMTFLLPGIGAQGGDIAATMAAASGGGMIFSASRSILYASAGDDFAEAARNKALDTRDEINGVRE